MTTVAMPVFSKKKETLSHGILLGVVGTDIPLVEVMMLTPRYKVQQGNTHCSWQYEHSSGNSGANGVCFLQLGAHGYAFLITNNGYILAHPDLRPLVSRSLVVVLKVGLSRCYIYSYYQAIYSAFIFFPFLLQYKDGKKLKPKPNYNSVDLTEAEWEDSNDTVSFALIDA